MRCLIVLLNCFILWSCAGVRHTTVPAVERVRVEQMIEGRQYAVEFRYPGVDNPNRWRVERAVCLICGDTLRFFPYYASQPRTAEMSFRIEDYQQVTLESGAVEVMFSSRELILGAESPVAHPCRFVIYSTEYVEIHVDASFVGATDASVFKGTLSPCEEAMIGETVRAIEQDGISIWPNGSDLRGMDSPVAKIYMVGNTLPYTVLIDDENKIVAKGLLGDDLRKAVAELTKKNKRNN